LIWTDPEWSIVIYKVPLYCAALCQQHRAYRDNGFTPHWTWMDRGGVCLTIHVCSQTVLQCMHFHKWNTIFSQEILACWEILHRNFHLGESQKIKSWTNFYNLHKLWLPRKKCFHVALKFHMIVQLIWVWINKDKYSKF